MQVLPYAQGTPEWLDARATVATASNFKRIMTPATQKLSTQAEDYAAELVAEKFCGIEREAWKLPTETADMQHGKRTEGEARRWFQLERDVDVQEVGLCIHDNGRWGASPDGLIGDDSGLELKCPRSSTQVRWLADGIVPVEHLPQIHGALIVTGRQSWWFMSYVRGLPPLLLEVTPSDYTEKLRGYLEEFNAIYDRMADAIQARLRKHIDAEIDRRNEQTPKELKSFIA